ncbi:hypothetical protein HanRHA438_Chr10g0456821 [Helianthus annuus]|uniref:Uncharacterized protein n=1 Tax=Helianthus annuus TaxID=4232 RepID=A0A9K3HXX5_HELAN|nr:hypothetical protein HanXRQr2_Chr10g0444421 [Helianthus annuus]KAJ0879901.1 hypothetical protein HanRHA438_Chr10g0456821 [Helianthus annuus]KAJ0884069.1 hypothetical protein HanPSC8_Chr10g0429111 [Helianthus annuus]
MFIINNNSNCHIRTLIILLFPTRFLGYRNRHSFINLIQIIVTITTGTRVSNTSFNNPSSTQGAICV